MVKPTVSAVLFCCSLNAVRSPIAEALAKQKYGTSAYIDSVGSKAGDLDGFMVTVMKEIGIDMGNHHPKDFEMLENNYFDLIVVLSPQAMEEAKEYGEKFACPVIFWDVPAPTKEADLSREAQLLSYRAIREEIARLIDILYEKDSPAENNAENDSDEGS